MKTNITLEKATIHFDSGSSLEIRKLSKLEIRNTSKRTLIYVELDTRKKEFCEEKLSFIIKTFIKKTLSLDKVLNANFSLDLYLTLSFVKIYHKQIKNMKEKTLSYIPEIKEVNLGRNTTVENVYNALIKEKENFLNNTEEELNENLEGVEIVASFARGRYKYFELLYPYLEIVFLYSFAVSEYLPDSYNSVPTS
ncbi:hypothetical protein YS40_126 [Thermus phage phiYS40]|uniref:hypothetical protein n=1 Tax=Thermus phage phiYS40 TaxID=407392 RepID=UPI0000E689F4|nr:hypothetical protein YS40_126 [Thermus phage phiYS40]ABJ91520.1 hypothetical protein YS40_126 [Thermus phage phiYS40]BAK53644.1 hypothetical protein YSP_126 [Thermus phage phiYS40]